MRDQNDPYARIRSVVADIPRGHVATYGQVARLAGRPGHARQVGYALHNTPNHMALPWHRVINARGEISFPRGSSAYRRQRRRLEAEGIEFRGERVSLERYRWRPGTEDLPPEYLEHA